MDQTLSPLYGLKDQFSFVPEIKNKDMLATHRNVIVCGMGGSAISVTLLQLFFPELRIKLHNSYGLPKEYTQADTLCILNSYSGNTEEILEAFERAVKDNASVAILSRGGTLQEVAKKEGKIYVELPESSLEPRFSIGHQMIGLLSLMNEHEKIEALRARITLLSLEKLEKEGRNLATLFAGKYPVLYSSENLHAVAYLIKAAINEGAKIPSFVTIIPEGNHNELQSFVTDDTRNESAHFAFLHLTSSYDHVRILKRLSIMETLYTEQGFTIKTLTGNHTDILSVFELVITGYFMATFLAIDKGIDPYATPLIAEFKKRMTQ